MSAHVKRSGGGARITMFVVSALIVGLLVAVAPTFAGGIAVLVLLVAAAGIVPERWLLPGTLLMLLVIPLDNTSFLVGQMRAVVALGLVTVGAVLSGARWHGAGLRPGRGRARAALMVWFVVLGLLLVFHRDAGVLRLGSIWAVAAVLYVWICVLPDRLVRRTGDIATALALAGALQGLVSVVDRVAGSGLLTVLPGYVPTVRTFGQELGLRATGLAGHPLRVGTICMLALLVCVARLTGGEPRENHRMVWVVLGVPSALGLMLSGARGSWVSLACGAAVLLVARVWTGEAARRPTAILGVLVSAVIAWYAFSEFVTTRLGESGLGSESLAQRTSVIGALTGLAGFPLVTGAGFSGYAESLYAVGLRYVNVENEYILVFLSGGLLLLGALVGVVADTLVLVLRTIRHEGAILFGALGVAMVVNIGTYNPFSWTVGPALFSVVLACLAVREWYENRPAD